MKRKSGLPSVLLDTQVWAWTLLQSDRLSRAARRANDEAHPRYVSPVSFYEITQKVRLGTWPEMAPHVSELISLAEAQGLAIAMVDAGICARAGSLAWAHRDPFDRMLAATALHYGIPIISTDTVFDGIVTRFW